MDNVPCKPFDWEIKRKIGPGYYRTYASGYWWNPFVVIVLGRVLIGKRALRKRWSNYENSL